MILAAGATAAAVLSGGLAWASWTTGSASGTATVRAAQIPIMRPPRAEMSGTSPRVVWTGISPTLADHYVVVRSDGTGRHVACAVDANTTTCRDEAAAPGTTVEYYVHATLAAHWVGRNSDPSGRITVPAESTLMSSEIKTGAAPVQEPKAAEDAPATTPATTKPPTTPVMKPSPPVNDPPPPPVESSPTAATTDPTPQEPVADQPAS